MHPPVSRPPSRGLLARWLRLGARTAGTTLNLGGRHADWRKAFALFDDHVHTRWGLAARLRVAVSWGKHSVTKQAPDDLMAIGPSQTLKLECGRAYAHTGAFARAREVLAQVAEDESAPSRVRADAFALLVRIVGPQLGEWSLADELHREWVRVRPGDTRASAFAPTIASRLYAERQTQLRPKRSPSPAIAALTPTLGHCCNSGLQPLNREARRTAALVCVAEKQERHR